MIHLIDISDIQMFKKSGQMRPVDIIFNQNITTLDNERNVFKTIFQCIEIDSQVYIVI